MIEANKYESTLECDGRNLTCFESTWEKLCTVWRKLSEGLSLRPVS